MQPNVRITIGLSLLQGMICAPSCAAEIGIFENCSSPLKPTVALPLLPWISQRAAAYFGCNLTARLRLGQRLARVTANMSLTQGSAGSFLMLASSLFRVTRQQVSSHMLGQNVLRRLHCFWLPVCLRSQFASCDDYCCLAAGLRLLSVYT